MPEITKPTKMVVSSKDNLNKTISDQNASLHHREVEHHRGVREQEESETRADLIRKERSGSAVERMTHQGDVDELMHEAIGEAHKRERRERGEPSHYLFHRWFKLPWER